MLFMEFPKCVHIFVKTYWDFSRSNSNAMSIAYAIVKTHGHDELSICCITFTYVYNKLFTCISLHNNWTMLLSNVFVIGICESYIVQHKLRVDIWIFTNILWLLFMNMCWNHFLTNIHFFPMIAYVCCSYNWVGFFFFLSPQLNWWTFWSCVGNQVWAKFHVRACWQEVHIQSH